MNLLRYFLLVLCFALIQDAAAQTGIPGLYIGDECDVCSGCVLRRLERQHMINPSGKLARQMRRVRRSMKKDCDGGGPPCKGLECIVGCQERAVYLSNNNGVWEAKRTIQELDANSGTCRLKKSETLYATQARDFFDPKSDLFNQVRLFNPNEHIRFDQSDLIRTSAISYAYSRWRNASSSDTDFPEGTEVRFLEPSAREKTVFLVIPETAGAGRSIPLKQLNYEWFVLPRKTKADSVHYRQMSDVLEFITDVAVADPAFEILVAPDRIDYNVCLGGIIKDAGYISCDNPSYTPLRLSPDLSHAYARHLLEHKQTQELPFSNLLKEWKSIKERRYVKAILPANCGASLENAVSPLEMLGVPPGSDVTRPDCFESAFDAGGRFDVLLTNSNTGHQVWRADGSKSTTWVSNSRIDWLNWLAIKDPGITVLRWERNASGWSILFLTSGSDALWLWESNGKKAPKETEVLDGQLRFELTGEPVSKYLNALKELSNAADTEVAEFASGNFKQQEIIPLDFLELNGRRLLLYQKKNTTASNNHYAFSANGLGSESDFANIEFYLVDGTQEDTLQQIRKRYNSRSRRDLIKRRLLNSGAPIKELWFGLERLAIIQTPALDTKTIEVFLGQSSMRNLPRVNLNRLLDKVRNAGHRIYLGHNQKLKINVMVGLLSADWKKSGNWRADPLGLFDTVL